MTITKDKIIKTAIAILSEDGLDGLSMRSIAKELGVSEQNLLTAGNLPNNYILSFVADEIQFRELSKNENTPIELLFAKDLKFSEDYDQQFVYGLEVILAGLERAV